MMRISKEELKTYPFVIAPAYILYWTIKDRKIVAASENLSEQLSSLEDLIEARIFNEEKEYHLKLIDDQYHLVEKVYNDKKPNLVEYQLLDDQLSKEVKSIAEYKKYKSPVIKIIKEIQYDEEIGQAYISSFRLSSLLQNI